MKVIILLTEQDTSTVYASFNNGKESSENNHFFMDLIMKFKTLITCLYGKWVNYNLFFNRNDDYIEDPIIILKHQKYKTWLYVLLTGEYTCSFLHLYFWYMYVSYLIIEIK